MILAFYCSSIGAKRSSIILVCVRNSFIRMTLYVYLASLCVCMCVCMCWFLGLISYLWILNTELLFIPWLSGNLKLMVLVQVMWVNLFSWKNPNFEFVILTFWIQGLKKNKRKNNSNILNHFSTPTFIHFFLLPKKYCLCRQLCMVHILFREACLN